MKPRAFMWLAALVMTAAAPQLHPSAARASVFCAASVSFVTPWDVKQDIPSASDTSRLFLYGLEGDGGGTVSGTLMVVTDKKAYRVPFSSTKLVPSQEDAHRFLGSSAFFSLPHDEAVRYAWVDDATNVDDEKDAACATQPYTVKPLSAEDRASMTPLQHRTPPKNITAESYSPKPATFVQNLDPLTCAEPYRDLTLVGKIGGETDYFDSSLGRHVSALLRIDVDSNGKPAYVAVIKSSGSIAIDAAGQQAGYAAKFLPPLFRCEAVVGSYYYQLEYDLGN